jgi:ribonuclease Y
MNSTLMISILLAFVVVVCLVIGYLVTKVRSDVKLVKAKATADDIIESAKRKAETDKKEALLDAKEEIQNMKEKADSDIAEKKRDLISLEQRVVSREENVDRRILNLEKRETVLERKDEDILRKESALKDRESKVEDLIKKQKERLLEIEKVQAEKLFEISRLNLETAREIVLANTEKELEYEISKQIKDAEEKAKLEASKKAKNILVSAIQRYASEQTNDYSITVVNLPTDEMKGRIIGREGRNIRSLEALTGVDIIVDETPEAVVLSCFDPVRREIARLTLETLISDGRIHPARIEEVVDKTRIELDAKMIEVAENAIFDLGIGRMHKDLIRILGRLHYRTSYGQNVLKHSMEVAYLSGMIAAEIGEDERLARRAGLLHDIGKSVDHELEGSHVDIGVDLAYKYKESDTVIDAIASHHGDVEAKSLIAVIVAAADALSAGRPGARSESLENYMKRLEKLEAIASEFYGVQRAFAIQAGREIRIAVLPNKLDDAKTHKLAREVRKKIEAELNYPGNIKVTVIRETRVVEIAK